LNRWPTAPGWPPSAAEVLGAIYEALLDLDLVQREGTWHLVGWGGRRKRAGAYYSPIDLVRPTVARALGRRGPEAGLRSLDLRLCDPAMGTGVFLIAALRQLVREGLPAPEVAERCLFGVDRDPLAVDLARAALWIEVGEVDWPADAPNEHLRVGDSLVGSRSTTSGHYPLAAWYGAGASPGVRELRGGRLRRELVERIRGGAASEIRDDGDVARRADAWCATWFWPQDHLDAAPGPAEWGSLPRATAELVERVARRRRFFHWELEFPTVFEQDGFDAVVGNPPWEIRKPNSREFFSRIDPDYRELGKQGALARQRELFDAHPGLERRWRAHRTEHRATSWFLRASGCPFGDPTAGGRAIALDRSRVRSAELHARWREQRGGAGSGGDPYRLQGRADGNSYKLFLELALWLLRPGGRLGLLLPSGLYTDRGCAELRRELLDHNRWEWLYSFDNRDGIFDIHRSYRFGPVVVTRGGRTTAVRAAFQRIDPSDWSRERPPALDYPREVISRLSPRSDALLELRDRRDLRILVGWRGHPVGAAGGPPVEYSSGFHMTRDSGRFLRVADARAAGLRQDVYGHWLRGPWRPASAGAAEDPDLIPAPDGEAFLALEEVEDVALPLVQGAMIGILCSNASAHASGTGHRTRWSTTARPDERVAPQFLVRARELRRRSSRTRGLRTVFRALTNATNERTVIASLLEDGPCGNSLGLLKVGDGGFAIQAWSAAMLGSLVFDWTLRQRLAGTNLNAHFLWESRWPQPDPELLEPLQVMVARLTHAGWRHAPRWSRLARSLPALSSVSPASLFAVEPRARVDLRAAIDALMADACGLTPDDLRWILRDCGHPVSRLGAPAFRRGLDPKGFWRVDRRAAPQDRLPTLALQAHDELQRLGRHAFVERHLRPAGEQDGSEGWRECELHARRVEGVRALAGLDRVR